MYNLLYLSLSFSHLLCELCAWSGLFLDYIATDERQLGRY